MQIQQELETRTKEELKRLAKFYDFKETYKSNKLELCEALGKHVASHFMVGLEMIEPEAMKTFEKLIRQEEVAFDEIDLDEVKACMALNELGLITSDTETDCFSVPGEIVAAYKKNRLNLQSQRKLREKQQVYSKLRKIKDACLNLYGAIKVSDLITCYEMYEGSLEHPLFLEWLEKEMAIYGMFYVADGYLMSESFAQVSDEEVTYFLKEIENRPCYRPERETFLRYADEYYYEETPEIVRLRSYLNKQYPYRKEEVEEVILNMVRTRRYEISINANFLQDIMMDFEMMGFTFNHLEEVNRLSEYMMPALNSIRLWINRGYAAADLRRTPVARTERVGRNEPCPCGSGLKYKKCCGK